MKRSKVIKLPDQVTEAQHAAADIMAAHGGYGGAVAERDIATRIQTAIDREVRRERERLVAEVRRMIDKKYETKSKGKTE